ncbi:Uncharacterised protein [Clostridium paraputrificum]|nr:Uncharacterised protein [Clostridium paraputrificum]
MVSGHFSLNTMWAASGSTLMLNSATAVLLPSWYPPPMSTTSATRSTMAGSLRAAMAMLVSGPVGTSVTVPAGSDMTVSMMKSTAWASSSGTVGTGTA